MEVILDTNFILSCIRKRIDFLGQLQEQGFKIVVPKEVFEELKDLLENSKTSQSDRTLIDVGFQLLREAKVSKVKLGAKTVDKGLVRKGREGVYVATLDKAVQRAVPNRVIILNAQKSVGIERD